MGGFFCVDPTGSYDAVIGNPPYVRYQDFSGEGSRPVLTPDMRAERAW